MRGRRRWLAWSEPGGLRGWRVWQFGRVGPRLRRLLPYLVCFVLLSFAFASRAFDVILMCPCNTAPLHSFASRFATSSREPAVSNRAAANRGSEQIHRMATGAVTNCGWKRDVHVRVFRVAVPWVAASCVRTDDKPTALLSSAELMEVCHDEQIDDTKTEQYGYIYVHDGCITARKQLLQA